MAELSNPVLSSRNAMLVYRGSIRQLQRVVVYAIKIIQLGKRKKIGVSFIQFHAAIVKRPNRVFHKS